MMAQAVSRRLLTAKAIVLARVTPSAICDGQSDTETRFPSSSSGLPVKQHSTVSLHTHISSPGDKQ
jgi:hypothetical protein